VLIDSTENDDGDMAEEKEGESAEEYSPISRALTSNLIFFISF
jgi:hypothetical protein